MKRCAHCREDKSLDDFGLKCTGCGKGDNTEQIEEEDKMVHKIRIGEKTNFFYVSS